MTLQEFYQSIGGDYEEVRKRLTKEERIQKFVLRFLEDDSFKRLCEALEQENHREVFQAVHTLKGVALNLGFQKLYQASAAMTEEVRGEKALKEKALFEAVEQAYEETIIAIQKLKNSDLV